MTRAVKGLAVDDPAVWIGAEIEARDDWLYRLSEAEIDDLALMAGNIRHKFGDDPNALLSTTAEDFDLGGFADRLAEIQRDLKDGLGFALIRGLPLDEMELADAIAIYWGIGRHMGRAVSNNPEGDMIGHVMDMGKDMSDPRHRGYQTRETLDFHIDQCDAVGLLCLEAAKSGGLSKIASSPAVYNELLNRRPDLLDVLCQPFCWTMHGEVKPGEKSFYETPVFNFVEGAFSAAFGPVHMRKGHALEGAPDITEQQLKAIEVIEEIAEDLHYAMELQKGDIQFVNNSVLFHTRTEYQDWPEPDRHRQLWRLWLVIPDFRPLDPFHTHWRSGIHGDETVEHISYRPQDR